MASSGRGPDATPPARGTFPWPLWPSKGPTFPKGGRGWAPAPGRRPLPPVIADPAARSRTARGPSWALPAPRAGHVALALLQPDVLALHEVADHDRPGL